MKLDEAGVYSAVPFQFRKNDWIVVMSVGTILLRQSRMETETGSTQRDLHSGFLVILSLDV